MRTDLIGSNLEVPVNEMFPVLRGHTGGEIVVASFILDEFL